MRTIVLGSSTNIVYGVASDMTAMVDVTLTVNYVVSFSLRDHDDVV